MPPPRHPVSDLVSDAKIETTILSDSIQHVFYAPGHSAQRRQEQRVENWSRERKLGEGAFGVVYLERCQPEVEGGACKLRAVKQIKKHIVPEQELDYMRELEAIFKFSNPRYSHCFVRSDGWFEEGDYVFISMEYLEHGDLQTHLVRRPLPEIETRQITSQVLEGLEYMHENGFVHRDLKPSNIMVVSKSPEWFVKIADFGISKRRQQGATTTDTMNKGTLGFTAPEVFGFGSGEGDGGVSYSFAVDLWSLGAVVYLMLTNTLVFPTLGDLFKYATGATVFPADRLKAFQISEQVLDLVTQLMIPTAVDRPTAKSAMGHSWMTAPLIQLKGTNSDGSFPTNENKSLGSNLSDVSVPSARWTYSSSERTMSIKTAETMPSSSMTQRPTALRPIPETMNKPHESPIINRNTNEHPTSQSAAEKQKISPVIHNTRVDQSGNSGPSSGTPSKAQPTKYLNPWFEDEDDDDDSTPIVHNSKTEFQDLNTAQGDASRPPLQGPPRQFLVPATGNENNNTKSLSQLGSFFASLASVSSGRPSIEFPTRDMEQTNQSRTRYIANDNEKTSVFVNVGNRRPPTKWARDSLPPQKTAIAYSRPPPPTLPPPHSVTNASGRSMTSSRSEQYFREHFAAKPVTPVSPRLEPWTPLPPSVYFANTPPLLVDCHSCKRQAKRLESMPISKCAHWICNPCLRRAFNNPMLSKPEEEAGSPAKTTAATTTVLKPPTCCPGSVIPLRAVLTTILGSEARRHWINIYSSIPSNSEIKTWTPAPVEGMRTHRRGRLCWRQKFYSRSKDFDPTGKISFGYVPDDDAGEEENEEGEKDKHSQAKDVRPGDAVGDEPEDVAASSVRREHNTSQTGSIFPATPEKPNIPNAVRRPRELRGEAAQLQLLAEDFEKEFENYKRLYGGERAATGSKRESSTSPAGLKDTLEFAADAAVAAMAAIANGRLVDSHPSQTDVTPWLVGADSLESLHAVMSKRFDRTARKPVNPSGQTKGTVPGTGNLKGPGANGSGTSEQRLPSILKKTSVITDTAVRDSVRPSGSVVGRNAGDNGRLPVIRRRASSVVVGADAAYLPR